MRVDEKEFFKESTLRISSSLEIEKALWKCLLYIQKFIPAEEAFMHYYDPQSGASVIFVTANNREGRYIDLQAPWPDEFRRLAGNDEFPHAFISNRADEHPMAKPILEILEKGKSSILTIRLTLETDWLGGVSFWADGWDRFNREHLNLLSLIRQPLAIALSNSLRYREVLALKDLLADDNRYLQNELRQMSGGEIVGADFGLKGVMDLVRQVAPLDSPVMLLGETGTGKELIAHAIHSLSHRNEGPMIQVNCGAIPESLMDSELFGHEKGAFTGALSLKRGRFERAHGGTIFLDEVGELTPEAQVRLLRVLQEKEIERVGGTGLVKVDIRVIAATHRDLPAMVEKGTFREDLFFRLQVFPIAIPPLRKRVEDIPSMVQHFVQKKSREMKLIKIPALAHTAISRLKAYPWPGNVRELENAVERALILSRGEHLTFSELQTPESAKKHPGKIHAGGESQPLLLDSVMAIHIQKVLEMAGGRVEGKGGAAELLGLKPGTLRHRMRKLSIPFGRKIQK